MALADFRNAIITEDKFSKTFSKLDSTVEKSGSRLDSLGKSLTSGGLGMLFGGAVGVAGAVAIGKTVWALGELGAQSITTRNSFEMLMRSVGASPMLLDQLKAAAGGTVTEMGLMQSANTALAGATGQLASEMAAALPKLLEGGRAAAMLNPAYGDATFMFNSLVTGIKRGSPMLIDNTGITLKLGEATEAYAASIGKSTAELTANERSIAILRATMGGIDTLTAQVGGSFDTMTSDIDGAKVGIQELKTALGELLAPSVAAAASGLAGALREVTGVLQSTPETRGNAMLEGYIYQLERLNAIPEWQRTTLDTTDIEDYTAKIAELRREMGRKIQEEQAGTMITKAAAWSARDAAGAIAETGSSATMSASKLAALTATVQGVANGFAIARGMAAAFNAEISNKTYLGGVDVLSEQQYLAATQARNTYEKGLQIQLQANIITQEQLDFKLAAYDRRMLDHIGTLRDTTKATSDLTSSMADTGGAYDDLKSRISGALRPTFDLSALTGGAMGGAMGDTFDEAYKRLAAVALRPEELQIHAQDWAGTFEKAGLTGLSPEDAQAEAARLVDAYSKGLDFSLIDREAIKNSVRQSIKAEEIYNTIVDEIYAEMGKEKPKLAQAGTAIGTQLNKAATATVKSGAADYVGAWVSVLTPEIVRAIDARGRRLSQ